MILLLSLTMQTAAMMRLTTRRDRFSLWQIRFIISTKAAQMPIQIRCSVVNMMFSLLFLKNKPRLPVKCREPGAHPMQQADALFPERFP